MAPSVLVPRANHLDWKNAVLFVSVFLCLVACGCDGNTLMTGNLYDSKGNALPGYKVTLIIIIDDSKFARDQFTSVTDIEGGFSVGGAHSPKKLKYEFIIHDTNGVEVWKEFGYPLMSARKIVATLSCEMPSKQ